MPSSAPTRSLPKRPSWSQLRKQAKDLRKSFLAGDLDAVAEVRRFERSPDPLNFALADAQRVLARAYGFTSWAKLKQHVDGVNVRAFCAAANAGDVAAVRKLAEARPELVHLECGGDFGERVALHFAVLNRDAEMTRALMESGSDARKGFWPHRDATSAFTIAQERGYDEIVAIIQQQEERRRQELSSSGSKVSSKTDDVLKAILDGRCDEAIGLLESDSSLIRVCDNHGVTPLHVAAWTHNPELIRWLLDHQARVDARAPYDVPSYLYQVPAGSGWTSLDYAAITAGWSAYDGKVAFLENARHGRARFEETVELLCSHGAKLTPRAAVAIGDRQAVLTMHREGRLENEIHFFRGGLLSIAVRVNRIEMVALLLDLGCDVDESASAKAEDGGRSWGMPLWFAATCGRHDIAGLLLARGADVNAVVYACGDSLCNAYSNRDEPMQALLLEHGARITVEHVAARKDRETALAILEGRLPGASLNAGDLTQEDLAEQMLWAAGSNDPEIVRMCLPYTQRTPDDPWWNYVLMHATQPESFRLVLEHGVDPDVAGEGGYSMLQHLATTPVDGEHRVTFAAMLLDAGASLERRDPVLKSTPLGWACRWGRIELARLYLGRGANAVEPDAEDWATPLAWAAKGRHFALVELLHSHGAQ